MAMDNWAATGAQAPRMEKERQRWIARCSEASCSPVVRRSCTSTEMATIPPRLPGLPVAANSFLPDASLTVGYLVR